MQRATAKPIRVRKPFVSDDDSCVPGVLPLSPKNDEDVRSASTNQLLQKEAVATLYFCEGSSLSCAPAVSAAAVMVRKSMKRFIKGRYFTNKSMKQPIYVGLRQDGKNGMPVRCVVGVGAGKEFVDEALHFIVAEHLSVVDGSVSCHAQGQYGV